MAPQGTGGSLGTAGNCWVLQGTSGYILATEGSVCTAGYCWYCGVPQGIHWLLQFLCVYCRVLQGTTGYILATAGSVCTAGY